jgi:hypothetical protein
MPGVAKDEVKVSIDGRQVTVQAQARREEERKDGERVVYRERSLSSYARTFTLPMEVDQAEASAKLENGVLTLDAAQARRAHRGADHGGLTAAGAAGPGLGQAAQAQAPSASSARGQRGRTSKAPSVCGRATPCCSRSAAASAIMAPLSVHSASGG